MPKIDHIQANRYRIPLDTPLTDAMHGTQTAFEVITVQVTDAEGATGVGYTFTPGQNGGSIHAAARETLLPAMGEDADRIEYLWEKIWWHTHYGGRGGAAHFALSAFDTALWDLKAKHAGLPLWRLLGGYDPAVKAYAGGIDLDLTADELLAQTDGNLSKGFRAIKMKVGRDRLAEDVEKIAAMREHLGPDTPLMVDANMKYTVEEALRAARAFAPYDLTWFEEPIPPDNLMGHKRLTDHSEIPIAAGENLRTINDFANLIAHGVAFPEPDVTNCGGVTSFMKVAHLAEAHGLPVTSHGAHDITVHLLAACPNASFLEAHGFGLDAFIAHPLELKEGRAIAPERPGHGMEFDWEALKSVAVD
ncbi:MAG: mandelate racemase/muconate lactonizing enzyme family protein [Pseudomonadota bacterium]